MVIDETVRHVPAHRALNEPHISQDAAYGYIPGLDGIRAIAVLIVMVAHLEVVSVIPGGFGVTVFFFISGFLITRLLLAEQGARGTIGLRNFYTRRVIRLYPALLFMVIGSTALSWAMGTGLPSGGEVAAALLYFANVFQVAALSAGEEPLMSWTHLWSLAVEEHFYLVFPAVVSACVLLRKSLLGSVVILIAAVTMWRIVAAAGVFGLDPSLYTYMMTDTRIDSILWGCLLSIVLDTTRVRDRLAALVGYLPVLAAIGALLMTFVVRDEIFRNTIRYTVQGMALLVLVLNLYFDRRHGWAVKVLEWRPLATVGVLSYALYLWHFPIYDAVFRTWGKTPSALVLALVLSGVVAWFSFRFVEMPFVALRKRFGAHIVRKAVL